MNPFPLDEYEFEDRESVRFMARMADEDEQRAEASGYDTAESYRRETPESVQEMHRMAEEGEDE